MVKGNETIIKMKVTQLHFEILLNKPYTINVSNRPIPSFTFI
jgi:hypothetical protein